MLLLLDSDLVKTTAADPSPMGEQSSKRIGDEIIGDLEIDSTENSRLNWACLHETEFLCDNAGK